MWLLFFGDDRLGKFWTWDFCLCYLRHILIVELTIDILKRAIKLQLEIGTAVFSEAVEQKVHSKSRIAIEVCR